MVSKRTCGECTMCCRLLGVPELEKQAGTQCNHCSNGKKVDGQAFYGCLIYQDRPKTCQRFECLYLQLREELPDFLRPDRCGAVMFCVPGRDNQIQVHIHEHRRGEFDNKASSLNRFFEQVMAKGYDLLVTIGRERKFLTHDRKRAAAVRAAAMVRAADKGIESTGAMGLDGKIQAVLD